jgi:hypothetical protein
VAAREFHLDADGGVEVLRAQQAGAIARKFGFALPFQQRGDDRPQRPATERDEAERVRQPEQVHRHGAVHRMTGQCVPELVADHESHLVMRHQVVHGGGDDDERGVHADAHGVHLLRTHDEQLRFVRCVEHRDAFVEKLVEIGELTRPDARGAAQVQQAVLALAQHRGEHLEHLVETLQPAKRREGDAVGRVLPSA